MKRRKAERTAPEPTGRYGLPPGSDIVFLGNVPAAVLARLDRLYAESADPAALRTAIQSAVSNARWLGRSYGDPDTLQVAHVRLSNISLLYRDGLTPAIHNLLDAMSAAKILSRSTDLADADDNQWAKVNAFIDVAVAVRKRTSFWKQAGVGAAVKKHYLYPQALIDCFNDRGEFIDRYIEAHIASVPAVLHDGAL